jgi:hypothetical protein
MKVNRTFILVNRDDFVKKPDWKLAHEAICDAIAGVVWPPNAPDGMFTLPRIATLKPGTEYKTLKGEVATWTKKATNIRNGVVPLRQAFRKNMERTVDWKAEEPLSLTKYFEETRRNEGLASICLYPSGEALTEPLHEGVGEFDFWFKSSDGFRVVVEWETGNISSSHRSLNKMCLALMGDIADAAVLIVPSIALAPHLTDRIGNIRELQPYFYFWQSLAPRIRKGLLAVIEVEQDRTTSSLDLRDFIPSGFDGNAKKKRGKKSLTKKTEKR